MTRARFHLTLISARGEDLKKLVRARMEKTGESYQQAIRHVRADHEEASASKPDSKRSAERVARSRTLTSA